MHLGYSIVAKEALYTMYGFPPRMGYGKPMHAAAIREYGARPIHRMTFVPIKASR